MISFEANPTPNPTSIKFTSNSGPFIAGSMASYNSAEEAGDDSLGRALFGLPHVRNVFILPQFLTVTKSPEGDWGTLVPLIEDILRRPL